MAAVLPAVSWGIWELQRVLQASITIVAAVFFFMVVVTVFISVLEVGCRGSNVKGVR